MNKLRDYLPPDQVDCVVYHSPCGDGFGGAYVFWKYIKETCNIDDPSENDRVRFIPFSHMMSDSDIRDKILPQVLNRNVIYIDICPKESVFLDMLLDPNRAVVLDHHESGLKITEKFPPDTVYEHCYIDQTHSGCILAHQYCYPNKDPSLLLRCIEDRDIWAWKLEDISRPFTEAFYKSIPYDFKSYDYFSDDVNVHALVEEGKLLDKYKNIRIGELVKKAVEGELKIDDKVYNVYIINTTEYISDIGHVLSQTWCERLDRPCDFAIIWYYDERCGKIKVSLRSDSDRAKELQTNVSGIARYFGGGGHPNASGFSIDNPNMFLNVLNDVNVKENSTKFKFANAQKKQQPPPKSSSLLHNWYIKVLTSVCVGGCLIGVGYILGSKK